MTSFLKQFPFLSLNLKMLRTFIVSLKNSKFFLFTFKSEILTKHSISKWWNISEEQRSFIIPQPKITRTFFSPTKHVFTNRNTQQQWEETTIRKSLKIISFLKAFNFHLSSPFSFLSPHILRIQSAPTPKNKK